VGRTSAGPQDMLEAERIESSFAEPKLVAATKVTTRQKCSLGEKEVTESQNSRGWKGPLWVI